MKKSCLLCLIIIMIFGTALAEDYIRLNVDTLIENQARDWEFYVKRECPEPDFIMGISNYFIMNTVGNATWDFSGGYTPFAEHTQMWNLGGLLFTDGIGGTGVTSGFFISGGAAMPPGGMPVIEDEIFWFSLNITAGDLPYGSTGDGITIIPFYWWQSCPGFR
jgi:hypothetical protein